MSTFAVAVGVNLQVRANGELGAAGVPPAVIALGNMSLQFATIVVAGLLFPSLRRAAKGLLVAWRAGETRYWWFTGGLVGALVISMMGLVGPIIGVAVFAVAIVSGQMVSSLLVDRWGLGPAGERSVSAGRLISAGLALVAVVLAVSDRLTPDRLDPTTVIGVLAALLAGFTISFQAAANGRLAQTSGQPAVGAGVNFLVGVLALALLVPVAALLPTREAAPSSHGSWWLYAGAFFGLLIVVNTAWAVKYLGILLLTVVGVSGQVLGAVAVDLLIPTREVDVTVPLVLGAALTVVAVVVGVLTSSGGGRWRAR
ncbi:MAG: DMT family transporter [Planctomycetota bacterium]